MPNNDVMVPRTQTAVFGLAAVLGEEGKYMVAAQTGQGGAGILVVLIRVATDWGGIHSTSTHATLVYQILRLLFKALRTIEGCAWLLASCCDRLTDSHRS